MTDLREYKEAIKKAVEIERNTDPNWSWNVKAVNKNSAKIGWGYLDYIGEKNCFTVEITDDDVLHCVVGTIPNGVKVYAFVGHELWDDVRTFEEGIVSVISQMARSAHNTY